MQTVDQIEYEENQEGRLAEEGNFFESQSAPSS